MAIIKRIFDQALKKAGVSNTDEESADEAPKVEPVQQAGAPIPNVESPPPETSLESEDIESLWDLSELDPEIYKDVFQSDDSTESPEGSSDEVESVVEGAVVSQVQRSDVPATRAIAARVQRVSADDTDTTDEPGAGVLDDEDVLEAAVAAVEEPTADVMEIEEDEDSEVSALFGEKVEIRPQVKQLLDKYGTIPAEQLLREIQDTNQLLSRDESK